MPTDATHDPTLKSWVESANAPDCDFPIQNLPLGVFADAAGKATLGVAIGDQILDLSQAADLLDVEETVRPALGQPNLNGLMALGPDAWRDVRAAVSACLADGERPMEGVLVSMGDVEMLLPVEIGDYTDFYAARHHATNVGRMFRPDGDPLMPNWLHLPVGYHGRASSIVVSGTDIRRPHGQLKPEDGSPVHGPCRLLDYELEFGAIVGCPNAMGEPVDIGQASDHIFGVVILNDWSARDVQKWEYQPLGPFNAKNFASSISPWVVTMDALAPFREHGPPRQDDDPPLLEYLKPAEGSADALDITAEVFLSSEAMRNDSMPPMRLSRGSVTELSWSFAQMLAHHTSTGCPMRAGDLLGSGTVSGPSKDSRGCLLELTWRGSEPIELPDGTQRRFLQDGDELTMTAFCERPGAVRIGLGTCTGIIRPAQK